MAERGLDIQVRTKAELAGLEETKNKLAEVKTVAEQLAAAGAKFDPKTNSFVSTIASDAGKATEGLKFTRYELASIAQQLVTGNVSAQSLSRSLSALSLPITAAALAGFALERIITASAEAALEVAKNAAKQATEIRQVVARWDELVQKVRDLGGEVRLADKIRVDLAKMELDMADFRTRQLPLWKEFADQVASNFSTSWTQSLARLSLAPTTFGLSLFVGRGGGATPFQSAADRERQQAQERYNQLIKDANIELDRAKQKSIDWATAEADLPKGIQTYTDRVAELTIKLERLDSQRHANLTDPEAANAYSKTLSELNEAKKSLEDLKKEQEDLNDDAGRETAIRRELAALMREQATILQGIRQQQQLINENPFMGIDPKNAASLASYTQEQQLLASVIQQTKAAMQNSALDPAQYEQLNQKLQQSTFEFELLRLKMVGLQQPVRTELVNWVNSFGSASHQIATTIEGSINAALQGTNQLLLDAAYRTGNWKQTLQGVERQILNTFLTMLEQMALQQAASLLHITANTTAQTASGAAIAAAHAPAAAATSISSYGVAALVGEAAALAAIFAIMGALAHEGGEIGSGKLVRRRMHSGGLSDDEVPIIAQEGEIMIQRSVAQQPGMADYLLGLNAGTFHSGGVIPRYHGGGSIWEVQTTYGPGSPNPTAADRKEIFGSYGNRLHWGDIAVSYGSGVTPGRNSYVFIDGQWWHVADYTAARFPPGRWDIYYPKGFAGRGEWKPGASGFPKFRFPGDPKARQLGFGKGGRSSRMGFPGFNARHGFDLGGPNAGDRPGFADYTGVVPGGYDPYMAGREWGSYDPITGRVTVGYTPGGGSGGIPPGGYTSSGGFGPELPWQGSSAFGTHSGAPSGYDAHGNPVYGGQMGGFNIPGGIGLPGLGRGSGGDIPFFSRMALNRFRSGGDPSFGYGPGSALYDFAAARHGRGGWSRRFAGRPTVNFGGGGQFERGSASRFGPNARAMSRVHSGGMIGNMRIPRLHGGGDIGGASSTNLRSGEVNIHNYTDLKTLVKEMATRKGRNIIVDTVRGSRIDLGIR